MTVLTLIVIAILQGCGANDFNYGKVRNIIEGSPLRLDAEYVMLKQAEYECGVAEDLWVAPPASATIVAGQTSTARVTSKGQGLKFSDDVMIGEKRFPYVQIRGDFNLTVIEISSTKSGGDEFTQIVEAKVGAVVSHSCFPNPLPLMGVRKGQFTQDYAPIFLFKYNNGWSIDSIVHN